MSKFVFNSYHDTAYQVQKAITHDVLSTKNSFPSLAYAEGWQQIAAMSTMELAKYLRQRQIWSLNGALKHFEKEVQYRAKAIRHHAFILGF